MPRGKWTLPGPGIEPMSPALPGGFVALDQQGSPGKFSLRPGVCVVLVGWSCWNGCPQGTWTCGQGQSKAGRGTGVSQLAVALVG